MSWHFLERWLEKANQHSTLIGKFWITFLIVCRMIVIGSLGDRVYADEQSEFRCNTAQPGCNNVCFNIFSPISHLRFWGFQIIVVTLPSIIFLIYSGHKAKQKLDMEKEKQIKEKANKNAERLGKLQQLQKVQQNQQAMGMLGMGSMAGMYPNGGNLGPRAGIAGGGPGLGPNLGRLGTFGHSMPKNQFGPPKIPDIGSTLGQESQKEKLYFPSTFSGRVNDVQYKMTPLIEITKMIDKKPNCHLNKQMSSVFSQNFEGQAPQAAITSATNRISQFNTNNNSNVLGIPGPESLMRTSKLIKEEKASDDRQETLRNMISMFVPSDLANAGTSSNGKDNRNTNTGRSSALLHYPSKPAPPRIVMDKTVSQHFYLYLVSVFFRFLGECIFLYMQYHLFGFNVPNMVKCSTFPCPGDFVDCFISRSMEKTLFLNFMFGFTVCCMLMNIIELGYLCYVLFQKIHVGRKFQRYRYQRKQIRIEKQRLKDLARYAKAASPASRKRTFEMITEKFALFGACGSKSNAFGNVLGRKDKNSTKRSSTTSQVRDSSICSMTGYPKSAKNDSIVIKEEEPPTLDSNYVTNPSYSPNPKLNISGKKLGNSSTSKFGSVLKSLSPTTGRKRVQLELKSPKIPVSSGKKLTTTPVSKSSKPKAKGKFKNINPMPQKITYKRPRHSTADPKCKSKPSISIRPRKSKTVTSPSLQRVTRFTSIFKQKMNKSKENIKKNGFVGSNKSNEKTDRHSTTKLTRSLSFESNDSECYRQLDLEEEKLKQKEALPESKSKFRQSFEIQKLNITTEQKLAENTPKKKEYKIVASTPRVVFPKERPEKNQPSRSSRQTAVQEQQPQYKLSVIQSPDINNEYPTHDHDTSVVYYDESFPEHRDSVFVTRERKMYHNSYPGTGPETEKSGPVNLAQNTNGNNYANNLFPGQNQNSDQNQNFDAVNMWNKIIATATAARRFSLIDQNKSSYICKDLLLNSNQTSQQEQVLKAFNNGKGNPNLGFQALGNILDNALKAESVPKHNYQQHLLLYGEDNLENDELEIEMQLQDAAGVGEFGGGLDVIDDCADMNDMNEMDMMIEAEIEVENDNDGGYDIE